MMKEFVINAIKKRKINKAHGLELLGNYLGPKSSKGEGKDIKIDIPVNVISPSKGTGSAPRGRDFDAGTGRTTKSGYSGKTGRKEMMASGGIARQNFAMGRRAFMKLLGGVGAGIGALKTGILGFGKGASKQVAKDLTEIPIQNAEGMPSWFKPLVNRVINEGDDVTKQFAWKERQIIHSKKLGEEQGVKVYQDLDNQTISVEYQSADNMGGIDDSVNLEYKAAEEIATKKGSVKTKPTFKANEAYPYQNPKDYKDVTFQDINAVNKVDDLYSDTSALKQFGTNKDLSKKELEIAKQKRKRVKKINEDPGGEELAPLYDPPDVYASGGIARMLGE
jgi:hypothetical protein